MSINSFSGHSNEQDSLSALQEKNRFLQAVFDNSRVGLSLLKAMRDEHGAVTDFEVLMANRELERLTNRSDLVGKPYSQAFSGTKETDLFQLLLEVMETGVPQQMEHQLAKDGVRYWLSSTFVKTDEGIIATTQNITEKKVAEEKQRHSAQQNLEAEQLKAEARKSLEIFQAGLNTQEEERRRIAESLHNGVGQLLYAVKISMGMVDLKKNPDHASLAEAKRTTEQLLSDAIKESRRISHELTPTILEDFGLKDAIDELCRHFEALIAIKFSFYGSAARLDRFLELSVYRMVQELLINVIKHAGATEATVQFEQQEQMVVVLWDNGIGFDPNEVTANGMGLLTIHHKVKSLGGTIAINSGPGTRITLTLPTHSM